MSSETTIRFAIPLSHGDLLIEMTLGVFWLLLSLQILKMIFPFATAWLPEKVHARALKAIKALKPKRIAKEHRCCKKKDL